MLEKMLMGKVEEQEMIIKNLRELLTKTKNVEREQKKEKSVFVEQYSEAYHYQQNEISYLNSLLNKY